MDITPCAQYQGETAIGETMGRNETELRDNEDTLQQPTELFIKKKKKKKGNDPRDPHRKSLQPQYEV